MELETRILRLWVGIWEEVTMTQDEWAKIDRLKNSSVELETVK
jgi:hypothetical protein